MPQPQSCKGDRKACCSGWKRNQLLKHWSFWKFQPQGLAGRASVWVSWEDPALPFSLGVSLGSWPSLRRRSRGSTCLRSSSIPSEPKSPQRHSGLRGGSILLPPQQSQPRLALGLLGHFYFGVCERVSNCSHPSQETTGKEREGRKNKRRHREKKL